jgi:hypothetical protein
MWRIPLSIPPNDPGRQQPTFHPVNVESPHRFNMFRHRFPQMYITIPQDLPQGSIVNVFHPARFEPIAVTPRDATGLYKLINLPTEPPEALGEMLDHNQIEEIVDPEPVGEMLDHYQIEEIVDPEPVGEMLDHYQIEEIMDPEPVGEMLDHYQIEEIMDPEPVGENVDPNPPPPPN